MTAAWVVLLRLAFVWGTDLQRRTAVSLLTGAAPFVGRWDPLVTPRLLVPVAVAVAAVGLGVEVAARARWSIVVVASAVASVAWVLALAFVDGADRITNTVGSRFDHLAGVGDVGSPGHYLATFVDHLRTFPTHIQGHPPGTVLALYGLNRLGLDGAGPALALMLAIGGVATAAVLVAARAVAGEAWARRSAPFVAFGPAALFATNADFAYTGIAATGLALVVLAVCSPTARSDRLAAAAGAVFGVGLLCSYGLTVMALPAAVVCIAHRRPRVALIGAVAALAVVAVPAGWGFWWLDGLSATRQRYFAGVGSRRPAGWFAFFDVVAFTSLLGPVGMVAVARLRSRVLWPVVGGVLAAVVAALASQMAKGEVERIWQPFVPWLLVAAGGLSRSGSPRPSRWWLSAHLCAGLGLAVALRSPW